MEYQNRKRIGELLADGKNPIEITEILNAEIDQQNTDYLNNNSEYINKCKTFISHLKEYGFALKFTNGQTIFIIPTEYEIEKLEKNLFVNLETYNFSIEDKERFKYSSEYINILDAHTNMGHTTLDLQKTELHECDTFDSTLDKLYDIHCSDWGDNVFLVKDKDIKKQLQEQLNPIIQRNIKYYAYGGLKTEQFLFNG